MGPTNVALVQLHAADQALREAQGRLDAATKNVRVQERRVNDLNEKIKTAQQKLRENQSHAANFDLDLKSRDVAIERLRTQQQNAKNNREYQAFLIEINTQKVDRTKLEEQTMAALEMVERESAELKVLQAGVETEATKLTQMKAEIGQNVAALNAEIEALKPARQAAAAAVPARALEAFDRLADKFEGDAMAPIARPDRLREEYICTACNMSLVIDVYNRLHTRDELVFCPSCRKILYIPTSLTPAEAIKAPPKRREKKEVAPPAAMARQTDASAVRNSIQVEEEPAPEVSAAEEAPAEEAPAEHQTSSSN